MDVNNYAKSYAGAENSAMQGQRPQCPDTYLLWAILTAFLCCTPLSIYAIVKAAQVEKFYYMGNYELALKASESAKKWSIISAVVALVGWLIYVTAIICCVIAGVDFSELCTI